MLYSYPFFYLFHFACTGEVFTHNPGAYDVDGDSLSYELAVPKRGPNDPVPNFFFPNGMSINPVTGDLVWDTPTDVGEYNIAINIYSYRNGQLIDTMVRDMQIIVEDCSNEPPLVITDVEEICVIAGTVIDFDVIATAPLTDTDQKVVNVLDETGWFYGKFQDTDEYAFVYTTTDLQNA